MTAPSNRPLTPSKPSPRSMNTSSPLLRFHRAPAVENCAESVSDAPAPLYTFPLSLGQGSRTSVAAPTGSEPRLVRRGSRDRLVAAKVREVCVEQCFEGTACAVLNGGDDPHRLGRIVTSGQLVREIEHTLDRMQHRLSDFRDHIDRGFQFPDLAAARDLPPAA